MKQNSKSLNIILTLLAVALLFLLSINVTYSYFSAQATISQSSTMGTLSANWVCRPSASGSSTSNMEVNSDDNTIQVYPSVSIVTRGVPFKFDYENLKECSLGFKVEGTTAGFIRFWVTVYESVGSQVINGKTVHTWGTENLFNDYFELTTSGCENALKTDIETGESNTIFYVSDCLYPNTSNTFINKMTLKENANLDIMGKTLQILIHFEVAQATNEAYKSAFGDWKGYNENWVYEE